MRWFIRQLEKNNLSILRRIFVCLRPCCVERIASYVTEATRPKTDKKTSKVGGLFTSNYLGLFLLFCSTVSIAGDINLLPSVPETVKQNDNKKEKEKTWYQKRDERPDIFYPHKAHYETMEKEGDSCMLCHTFQKNTEHDDDKRKAVNLIANEALEAICHDCHVTEVRAPWRCEVCHNDPKAVWPADHNSGYIENHGEDAKQNEKECKTCHLDTKFCSDCHFRRDTSGTGYHPLGYRAKHGLEARMMPANCSRCHNVFYCQDCHEQ